MDRLYLMTNYKMFSMHSRIPEFWNDLSCKTGLVFAENFRYARAGNVVGGMIEIRAKDRDAVIQSLQSGVVPRSGQHLIQVGRKREIEAMIRNIDLIAAGGSAVKFVIGEYGAGKTFFLNLTRSIAMEKGLVTANADLAPEKRLHATGGYAKSLYMELMRNVSTRSKNSGGAMTAITERFVSNIHSEAQLAGRPYTELLHEKLSALSEMVNGFDFAEVVGAYAQAVEKNNDDLKAAAVRWLRGEYAAKSDAYRQLGIRTIVDDTTWYDILKVFARFVSLAGYKGMMVCLDEMVNIYKLNNKQARSSNYEQILRIVNDSLQGIACGLGFVFGGTPDFQLDTRRGMFSYEALRRRLGENSFGLQHNLADFAGPVIRLSRLTQEDIYVLLEKIRLVYAFGDENRALLPANAIEAFMKHCAARLGNEYFRTPGTMISAFVNLLSVLEQNPDTDWQQLLGGIKLAADPGASAGYDDELLDV